MKYYPVLLCLKSKRCVVVGGGSVAWRKTQLLLKAGASVVVVSPALTKPLEGLKKKKKIFHRTSLYNSHYLKGAFLVIAATNDERINARVALDAKKQGALINVVDRPCVSDFIVPSVIAKNDLIVSISTSGHAPVLSKRMRKDFEKLLVPEYAAFLGVLKKIRKDLKARYSSPALRAKLLHRFVNTAL